MNAIQPHPQSAEHISARVLLPRFATYVLFLLFSACCWCTPLAGQTQLAQRQQYIETFPNLSGANLALSSAGWSIHYGPSAQAVPSSAQFISSGTGWDGGKGFLYLNNIADYHNAGVFPSIIWSAAVAGRNINVRYLHSVRFSTRNDVSDYDWRVALKIDGAWYVSTEPFNNSVPALGWTPHMLSPRNSGWRALNFSIGNLLSEGSAAALPSTGPLEAVGLFSSVGRAETVRVDSVSVCTVEPAYTETFDNTSGSNAALSSVGWNINYSRLSSQPPVVAAAAPPTSTFIASGPGSDTTPGCFFLSLSSAHGTGASPTLVWTSEVASMKIPARQVYQVRFYCKDSISTYNWQVALRVNGQWYVSTQKFASPNDATWHERSLFIGGSTWHALDFSTQAPQQLAEDTANILPFPTHGLIEGIGFFSSVDTNLTVRLDTVQLYTGVPSPLPNRPGNVFTFGSVINLPPISGRTGAWDVVDVDGNIVASGASCAAGFPLNYLPVGHYRVRVGGELVATAAVISALEAPVPDDSPVCLRTWFAGHYNDLSSVDAAASLAALAGVNGIRDSVAQTWPEQPTKAAVEAARRFGLDLLMLIEPATPSQNQVPADWGVGLNRKFARDLLSYGTYVRGLVATYGDVVSAWEAWNEPEAIGGMHLGSEIPSAMKVFNLAARSIEPAARTAMGMGYVPAEAMAQNGYLQAISSYNYHSHSPDPVRHTTERRALDPYVGGRPVWQTEASYGSYELQANSSELTSSAELRQAMDIPKLFARSIHDGIARVYYFNFIQFSEEANKQFGLLRNNRPSAGSLAMQPRSGYVSLAAAGRLLAGAKANGKLVLPAGLEGYAFEAKPDGAEKGVLVVWKTTSGSTVAWNAPSVASCYDLWGRPMLSSGPTIQVGEKPLYCVVPINVLAGLSKEAPVATGAANAPNSLSSVVADFRQPDRMKNTIDGYFVFPTATVSLELDVYNLGLQSVTGDWSLVEPVSGFSATVAPMPALAANGRAKLQVTLSPTGGSWNASSGASLRWLKLRRDYGGNVGVSEASIPFRTCPTGVPVQPGLVTLNDQSRWFLSAGGPTTASLVADNGTTWTRLNMTFGAATNSSIGTAWASPAYNILINDRPGGKAWAPSIWGLTFRLRLPYGLSGKNLTLNLHTVVNSKTYVWKSPVPYDPATASLPAGQRLNLPFSWFSQYRGFDSETEKSQQLQASAITGFEIDVTSIPNSTGVVDISNVAWASGEL